MIRAATVSFRSCHQKVNRVAAAALSTKTSDQSWKGLNGPYSALGVCAAIALAATVVPALRTTAERSEGDQGGKNNTEKSTLEEAAKEMQELVNSTMYDVAKQWGDDKKKTSDFFQSLVSQDDSGASKPIREEGGGVNSKMNKDSKSKNFDYSTYFTLLTGRGSSDSIADIAEKAREIVQDDVQTSSSLSEIIQAAWIALESLDKTMKGFFGDSVPPQIFPTNLYYFVEHEESRKNTGWKRRKHRFCSSLGIHRVEELDQKLHFAYLCYADTLGEIQDQLENTFGYELLYCDMESAANRPSHFIAVKRGQPTWSNALEVTLCVRGTKTITDVITDILCEEAEYRGGFAHAGMLQSGKHLANKHKEFLRQLCDLSGKSKIKLTIIGHSLGAGAASIAGMELNDEDFIDVEVYGFGAPATVSKEVSESAKGYITTIIADNDCIPRMSAATLINAVVDISEHDWVSGAVRDVKDAVSIAYDSLPAIMRGNKEKALSSIESLILNSVEIPEQTTKRMTPNLFPPGQCCHFYHDGFGVSAVMVPCDFFNELDINWRMVDDHLYFTGYKRIFLETMRQHKQDHYFLFETDRLLMEAQAKKK